VSQIPTPESLQERLEQAEQTLAAIRNGEVDALVVNSPDEGQRVFTLRGADWVYRVMVEQMSEGAATVSSDGTILYCNRRLADMVDLPLERAIGSTLAGLATPEDAPKVREFLASSPHPKDGLEVQLMGSEVARPVRLSASRLIGDLNDCLCVLILDLSAERRGDRLEALVLERTAELERMNANLRISERLATVGTLSAGLGHDMANLLLPVRASLDALDSGVEAPELKSDIAGIRTAVDYLQSLSRGGSGCWPWTRTVRWANGSVRFDEWFEDSIRRSRNVLPPGISLRSDVAGGSPGWRSPRRRFPRPCSTSCKNAVMPCGRAALER
jgi:PAS domain-containing protein